MSKKAPVKVTITLTKKQLSDLEDVLGFVMCHLHSSYEHTRATYGPRDPVTKSHIYLKALRIYNHVKETK